jgi:excisionase family DNA binding protein
VYLTTQQVAKELGVTPRRVRALIAAGRLKAKKIGRDHLIDSRDLAKFTPMPPGNLTGRPRHHLGNPRKRKDES